VTKRQAEATLEFNRSYEPPRSRLLGLHCQKAASSVIRPCHMLSEYGMLHDHGEMVRDRHCCVEQSSNDDSRLNSIFDYGPLEFERSIFTLHLSIAAILHGATEPYDTSRRCSTRAWKSKARLPSKVVRLSALWTEPILPRVVPSSIYETLTGNDLSSSDQVCSNLFGTVDTTIDRVEREVWVPQ
jgi:hypothetical protein